MDFTTFDMDLCRIGLGALIEANVFRVSEKFALEVIEDYFEQNPGLEVSIAFQQSLEDIQTVVSARGETVTAKGELFENLVFQALRRPCFQGKSVSNLPFVEQLSDENEETRKQEEWNKVIFKCTHVQALPHDSTDPRFVHDHPHVLLSPAEAHRADGILFLAPDHLGMLGVKIYTTNVPSDLILSQFRATNPDKAYEHAGEMSQTKSLSKHARNGMNLDLTK